MRATEVYRLSKIEVISKSIKEALKISWRLDKGPASGRGIFWRVLKSGEAGSTAAIAWLEQSGQDSAVLLTLQHDGQPLILPHLLRFSVGQKPSVG